MKLSRLPHQCLKLVTLTFCVLRETVIRRLLLTFGIGTSIGAVHFKSNLCLKKVILRLKIEPFVLQRNPSRDIGFSILLPRRQSRTVRFFQEIGCQ